MSSRPWCALAALLIVSSPVLAQEKKPVDPYARLSERDLLPKGSAEMAAWRLVDSIDDVPEISLESIEAIPHLVPEIDLQALLAGDLRNVVLRPSMEDRLRQDDQRIREMLDKARRLDEKSRYGFPKALLRHRRDLLGLPFLLGREADMDPSLRKHFEIADTLIVPTDKSIPHLLDKVDPRADWDPDGVKKVLRDPEERRALASLARQRFLSDRHVPLVQLLGGISHADATKYLAQIAIFSPHAAAREAAIDSLKVRKSTDYRDTLLEGMEYPLSSAVDNAADAILKLELTENEVLQRLTWMIDSGAVQIRNNQVREVVKINHHRNCALCHPASSADSVFVAAVPSMLEQLPKPGALAAGGYGFHDTRSIDFAVTYLRPDFSLVLPVPKAQREVWPEMQRFDFLVRTRQLSRAEAAAYEKARPHLPRPAIQRAALRILRELTGFNPLPTGEAWRKILNERDLTKKLPIM